METISFTTPKARKEHTCDWCNEKIEVGEKYTRAFCKEDDVYVWKNHIHCEEIAQELKMFDNNGSLSECDFTESIQEEYQRIMCEKFNEIYESKDFKYPNFKSQLDFVCSFYNIEKKSTNQSTKESPTPV
jgi:hypothetical protein